MTSKCHQEACEVAALTNKFPDIGETFSNFHAAEKANNRQMFLAILENIRYLARQGIPFRENDNEGNFDKLLNPSYTKLFRTHTLYQGVIWTPPPPPPPYYLINIWLYKPQMLQGIRDTLQGLRKHKVCKNLLYGYHGNCLITYGAFR